MTGSVKADPVELALRQLEGDGPVSADLATQAREGLAEREAEWLRIVDGAREAIDRCDGALRGIMDELGVPDEHYPLPVANAFHLARKALRIKWWSDSQ